MATSVVKMTRGWFIACEAHALKRRPLALTLQGTPLVLFRDSANAPRALLDRCPHRNVPLSLGTVTPKGELQCSYHGWCFDGAGHCRAVPGLVSGEVDLRSREATAFATLELDGYVWVYAEPGAQPEAQPFRFPHLDEKGYSQVRQSFTVQSSLHAAAENALDVPHTGFLHGGLFRSSEKRNPIEVVVRRYPTYAEAEYLGEPAPRGLLGRLLAPGGGTVIHFDRFLLPSIAQVEYRLGDSHLVATTALTPLADFQTRMFGVVSFRLPVPGALVKPFVLPVTRRILKQDAAMLRQQTETIARFEGEKFTSTELDVLGHEIGRLLRQAAGLEAPGAEMKEHRMTMLT